MIPSDDDVGNLRRCIRESMPLLAGRWPGALRQQLVLHLQKSGVDGGVSVPTQRLLRAAVYDPPRASAPDAASFNLFGVAAEYNSTHAVAQHAVSQMGRKASVISDISEMQVLRVDLDRNGTFGVSCNSDGSCGLWDLRGTGDIAIAKHELRVDNGDTGGKILGLALNSDGSRLVTHTEHTVVLWDISFPLSPKVLHTLPRPSHSGIISCVAISDDGDRIATGCGDRIVRVFNIGATSTAVAEMRGHKEWITGLGMSGDGSTVVSSSDHEVLLWSCATAVGDAGISAPTPGNDPYAVPVVDTATAQAPPVKHAARVDESPPPPMVSPVPLPDSNDPADHARWVSEVSTQPTTNPHHSWISKDVF